MQYVMIYGLWMTSWPESLSQWTLFGRVRQVAAPVAGRAALTGAKSATLDCLVFFLSLTIDDFKGNWT